MMEAVLTDLRAAGVQAEVRKPPPSDLQAAGGELDLSVSRSDWSRTREALESKGWRYLSAPGRLDHRFMLRCDAGTWFKIDVKLSPAARVGPRIRRLLFAAASRLPVSARRAGPVVAVLGPDGAGKGSVTAALIERVPVAVTVAYFGSRSRNPSGVKAATKSDPPAWRESAWLLVRLGRTWFRLASAYARARRGEIVLCDRHPLEVLAVRPERRPFNRKLERFLLSRLVPRPDAIVVLDASGEVLFERKGEHSPDILNRWRANYLEEFVPRGATVVSTETDLQSTIAAVSQLVWEELCERRRW
jgi:thymidylate kinase